MDDGQVVIKVENVSKVFKLPREKHSSLKSAFVNFSKRRRGYDLQRALSGISFEIKKGEFFGIVGRNGSGKSTLLKLLAGIYTPTSGTVKVHGSLTPFIELGVGFNMELTGRENVYLNGALLGFSRRDMNSMYEDIVDFAELGKFMDQKLKNYSSGMQVRLAFSIAIRSKSDILLIDEVLAVGDANFQKKCINYFNEIKKTGTTVIFVSHDMSMVERFCERALLINNGSMVNVGLSSKIAREYEKINFNLEQSNQKKEKKVQQEGLGWLEIKSQGVDNKGNETSLFGSDTPIRIRNTIKAKQDILNALISFTFENISSQTIFEGSSYLKKIGAIDLKKGQKVDIVIEIQNIFGEGKYVMDVEVSTPNRETIYEHIDEVCDFEVRSYDPHGWLLRADYNIHVEK